MNKQHNVLDESNEVDPINESAHSFLPVSINSQLENEVIKKALDTTLEALVMNWPSLGDEPLNKYSTPFLATMVFPLLFPDARGDPTNPCLLHNITFSNKVQHLIKFAEKNDNKWVY